MAMESARPRAVEDACVVQVLGPEHKAECLRLAQSLGPLFCASKAVKTTSWSAGAFVNQRLRGLVEGRDTEDPSFVEISLVVEPAWRRRGLGGALLEAAICWGQASGRSTLRMIFSRHDWSMRKLASKANSQFDIVLGRMSADVSLLAIPSPHPNQIGERNG
jgi:GNAT superfamily N-acetyltransferase